MAKRDEKDPAQRDRDHDEEREARIDEIIRCMRHHHQGAGRLLNEARRLQKAARAPSRKRR
jgi:hypothetical protein